MTSRTLVPILEQTKYREQEKNQRCGRKRVKQVAALIVVLVIALTCAILSAPNVTAPAKSRQIPARYTHSESLVPEDREVLGDIRTSFVPTGSIVIPADELPLSERDKISAEEGEEITGAVAFQNLVVSDLLFGSGDRIDPHKRIEDEPRKKKRETPSANLTNVALVWRSDPNNITVSRETWESAIDNDELEQHDYLEQDEIRIESQIDDNVILLNSFQSFWKGEDDAESIRNTQSEIMRQYMDLKTDPCVDFYQYACGNWAPRNPIPADKAGYDTFEMLRENLDIVLRDLLNSKNTQISDIFNNNVQNNLPNDQIVESDKNAVLTAGQSRKKRGNYKDASRIRVHKRTGLNINNKNQNDDDAELKAKFLYESCMNYEILERRGHRPLVELLETFGGWPAVTAHWNETKMDWLELMARLRLYNNDILISEWVGPDIKNSEEFVIQFDQTSLGLPTRDYFLQPSNQIYLEAYKSYLIKICTLLGSSNTNAVENADDIINFEIGLAKITSAPEDRRNVTELYRRMSLEQLIEMVPKIDWQRYLNIVLDRKADLNETVVIFALKYMQELVLLLEKTEPRTIANYLLWRFVRHRVNNLDDRFQEAKQKFYYILFGREQAPSRWKNCVTHVNSNMGMALGSMFVKKHFNEKSKNDTLIMTREIQHSFRELLNLTTWIDDETKVLASDKVDSMMLKIGYPGFILNMDELNERYRNVDIQPDKYFENTLNILQHLTKTEQSRLGQPVNKAQWNTAPAVVNAYYSRNKNQIMFPAGILQPPFYHRYFPRSLNYGGIGVVIGHEITHGFDDKGRLFDKHGNIDRWWHDIAIDMFHKKAQCLIDQYGLYTVPEVSMTLDGFNTQGENIADNGGIKQAFRAYKRWLQNNGDANETLPGLNATNTQLFFLNFAQVWCGTMRPEAIKNKLKTAVHSPGKFRVIGTLSNSEDFAKEYKCALGSPMNPVKKCNVW